MHEFADTVATVILVIFSLGAIGIIGAGVFLYISERVLEAVKKRGWW